MKRSRHRCRARRIVLALVLLGTATAGCGVDGQPDPHKGQPFTLQLEQARDRLAQGGPIQLPPTPAPPDQAGGTMIAFVEAVIHDLGNFWSGTFANAGLPYATTNYVILDNGSAPMQSACAGSEATAHGGPFYCSVGGQMPGGATTEPVIYIGAAWLADATSGVPNEDFSVATVMAHEFGHHVQHQLGVAETLPGKFRELGADCFGGIWANAAYRNGQLAPDDIEEAITVSWNAGSDLPDDDSPDPHGTRGERVSAFTQGYVSGDPATCLEA